MSVDITWLSVELFSDDVETDKLSVYEKKEEKEISVCSS